VNPNTTPEAVDGKARRRSFVAKAALAVMLALGMTLSTAGIANAATYSISRYICYDVKPIQPTLYNSFGNGVNFTLASHPNTTVLLATKYSWGYKTGLRGNVTGVIYNHYHVRFLDASGRVLWTENNSIPNGSKRLYYVGSNVKTIQVITDSGNWAFAPAVGNTLN